MHHLLAMAPLLLGALAGNYCVDRPNLDRVGDLLDANKPKSVDATLKHLRAAVEQLQLDLCKDCVNFEERPVGEVPSCKEIYDLQLHLRGLVW
ncbi:hypothetical protein RJ55_06458 [Drechmeria coniospora]|nr:hypothetical protein RJ55_06458 [Drechmeria coniospora]